MHGPRTLVRQTSFLDRFLFAYYAALFACCVFGTGERRCLASATIGFFLALYFGSLVVVRGSLVRGTPAGLIYRFGVYGVFQTSYFALRWVLPAARTAVLDGPLLALDLRLFRFEPAIYLDRFVNAGTTEWFAFFYFSYFFVLGSFVLPMLFLCRDEPLLSEFATGICLVFGTAHLLYIVVPGYGPWWYLHFAHPLPHGRFLDIVMSAVHAGGAQKDIFPSLHTAGPTFLTFFALRHRARTPFKKVWPVIAFFAGNIVIATLFLRWHYAIDVVAGLTLSFVMVRVAAVITRRETVDRKAQGLQPAWPGLRGR